ncbi:hypothetical protein GCM10010207_80290 [Streptomyces atratus]|uniref:hypothetical protein n=1 Tax=Streptomyces atratus TaxID=1893 RepID=UPI00166FC6B9|nr:hypothetical protein [Streptomyces atratus]GGT69793.1 hypothetical protein GCM10010207_80290 [Streptomyces atratus]
MAPIPGGAAQWLCCGQRLFVGLRAPFSYGLFRLAEKHVSPRFGWLLGYAKPPVYDANLSTG